MSTYKLREWKMSDAQSLAVNANNINIWNNVRDYFPHPYTVKDGNEFITMVLNKPKPVTDFAIEVEGEAVGGIGIVLNSDVERITTEIGYWLGERYWGRGLMTFAVKEMADYAFASFPIIKIYAPVFDFNVPSQRVLEKAGFEKEAILKQAAIKNGKIIDMHYYGLISPKKKIQKAGKEDYAQIMLVWESSVKATHHFLKPEDFEFYRNTLPEFFPKPDLYVLRSEEEIVAFMGISGENLEMLFVSGEARGKGYGKTLLEYAINKFHITKVDVNEQNQQAVGFYEKFGFSVVGRSEKDSMGKDYPILHLRLNKS